VTFTFTLTDSQLTCQNWPLDYYISYLNTFPDFDVLLPLSRLSVRLSGKFATVHTGQQHRALQSQSVAWRMATWKGFLEGSSRGLIEALTQTLLGGAEEDGRTCNKISSVQFGTFTLNSF
jgi:hypothetical protein